MEIGDKIGLWALVGLADRRNRKKFWKVQCTCSVINEVSDFTLKNGKSNGCRKCINKKMHNKRRNLPLVGDRYFNWEVINIIDNSQGKTQLNLQCDCGYTTTKELGVHYSSKRCRNCYTTLQTGKENHYSRKGYKDLSSTYWTSLKAGAISRDISFSLNIEEAWELFILQSKKCALTDIDISLTHQYSGGEQTASLDRIDSSKGYNKHNVQWVHKTLNYMKWTLTQEEFIHICKLVNDKHG